ncbi:MAG TPA: apolipoprotein N-acyltransferase [Gemmatimonadaceae bacterium]|nr:apolipoprotein N-acyltransferase [Gemmatimonadaceae bacterium]
MPTSEAGSAPGLVRALARAGRLARGLARWTGDLALALAGAVLLAAHLRSDALLPLSYVGLVPWVWLWGIRERRAGWGTFVAAAGTYWVLYHTFLASYAWWVPVAMVFVYGLPFLPFAFLLRIARRSRLPWTIVVPVAWVSTEWIFAHLALGRVADMLLGYAQAPILSLIQVADVGSVYLVSFIVAMVNGAIADVIAARAWSPVVLWRSRARWPLAAAAGILVAANLYGLLRLRSLHLEPGPRIGVVQPAVDHTGYNTFTVYGPTVALTARTWDAPGKVDLIVWPENSIQDYLDRFGVYEEDLKWLARRAGAPLLVGSYGRHPQAPAVSTNTVTLAGPAGLSTERYDKIRLMPWMEYVPFTPFLAAVAPDLARYHARLTAAIIGYATTGSSEFRGRRVTVFDWPGLPRFSALICFETMDPTLAREAVVGGARVLVNPTSEGLVGTRLQLQMLRIAALRAVETRVPVVRAGNMGISGYIAPDGRIQSIVRGQQRGSVVFDPGVATQRVMLAAGSASPYARFGDLFVFAVLASAVAGVAYAATRRPA